MMAAQLLTLRHRTDIKRQDLLAQLFRDPAKAVELRDVKPGAGEMRFIIALFWL
jgi:NADH-quinone oxidoreductase subunit J